MKKIIRLTEGDLHKIIKESVKKIIKESDTGNFDDFYSGEEVNQQQSQEQEVINQLLQLGVRDVTDAYGKVYTSENMDDYGTVAPEVVKQFLSVSGEQRLMKRGCVYQWFMNVGDRTLCSRHNFNNEDQAADNCDKYIRIVEKAGMSCDCYVDGIWFESNSYQMDTVLNYWDDGTGGFWND